MNVTGMMSNTLSLYDSQNLARFTISQSFYDIYSWNSKWL